MNKLVSLLSLTSIVAIFLDKTRSTAIIINSSQQLHNVLKQLHGNGKDIKLKLDSSVEYMLSGEDFYIIGGQNITMTSTDDQPVNISCRNKPSLNKLDPTRVLVFINSTVSIINLSFNYCGALLNTLPHNITDLFNYSSPLYYPPTHAAALLLINSKVIMKSVMFKSSYGFALICLNPRSSLFDRVTISSPVTRTQQLNSTRGSGMLLHFYDSYPIHNDMKVSLLNSKFTNNTEPLNDTKCISDEYDNDELPYPVMNAAGLTILFTQKNYPARVIIGGAELTRNSGASAGAVTIINLNSPMNSSVHLLNSVFYENAKFTVSKCHGTAMQYYWFQEQNKNQLVLSTPLFIKNSTFSESIWYMYDKNYQHTGAIYIGIYSPKVKVAFRFKKLYFYNNTSPGVGGTCMSIFLHDQFAQGSDVTAIMTDIVAEKNTNILNYSIPLCSFYFSFVKNVTLDGNNLFKNNFGTVLCGEESSFILNGNVTFKSNTGVNGGAISIEGNSLLYLMTELNASFINNRAYLSGGAIYVMSKVYRKCAIQPTSKYKQVLFVNNSAQLAGNTVFATPITKCEMNGQYQKKFNYSKYFDIHPETSTLNSLLPISTSPSHFLIYDKEENKTSTLYDKKLQKFPGEKFEVLVKVTDDNGYHVFSLVNVAAVRAGKHKDTDVRLWVTQSGENQVLEGTTNTSMNLSLHTNSINTTDVILVISLPQVSSKSYRVKILPCPLGFTLETLSGRCYCSSVINKIKGSKCSIDDKTIVIPGFRKIWIGGINNITALSNNCPLTYCNLYSKNRYLKITENETMIIGDNNKLSPLCLHNRYGVLCGKCDETKNYSVVFGSNECKQCSNWWLLTLLLYAIAGPLLIFVSYSLKLTLTTGTLNGIIFYAQVANAGLIQLMTVSYSGQYKPLSVIYKCNVFFLSAINLNLGFPLCFYNGMNQLLKTGLSLVFPVYLLVIVAVLVKLSQYSTWLSNKTSHSSVQVLVTVVHLSFSKLLLGLIDVFTPAKIQTEEKNYHVWYWDGSVDYMGDSHYPLIIVATLLSATLTLPYIALLLLAKPLMKYTRIANIYIRPIHEAIHAPYKHDQQYWFVARLLLLILIYVIYVAFRSHSEFVLSFAIASLLALFLIGQSLFRPFKRKLVNLLDSWLMLNITLVHVTIWHEITLETFTFNLMAIILAGLTFIAIIVIHLYLALRNVDIINKRLSRIKKYFALPKSTLVKETKKKSRDLHQMSNSFYGSCDQCREPLIEQLAEH